MPALSSALKQIQSDFHPLSASLGERSPSLSVTCESIVSRLGRGTRCSQEEGKPETADGDKLDFREFRFCVVNDAVARSGLFQHTAPLITFIWDPC